MEGGGGWSPLSGQYLPVLAPCARFLPGLHLLLAAALPGCALRRVPEPWHLEREGCPHSSGPTCTVPGWVSQDMCQEENSTASPARGGNSSAPGRCGDGSRVGVCSEPVSGAEILGEQKRHLSQDRGGPEALILSWPVVPWTTLSANWGGGREESVALFGSGQSRAGTRPGMNDNSICQYHLI